MKLFILLKNNKILTQNKNDQKFIQFCNELCINILNYIII